MKHFLNKKISIKTLLILTLTVCFSSVCIAASSTTIQATLLNDLVVKYNGITQVMKDGNGNIVYPISYNGAIYIPLKPISELFKFPMSYIEEQGVITIDSPMQPLFSETSFPTNAKSFLAVTDNGVRVKGGEWNKVNNKSELPPKIDDNGNIIGSFNEAIKLSTLSWIYPSTKLYTLTGNFNTLSFTAIANNETIGNGIFNIELRDYDKDIVIFSKSIKKGDSFYIDNINLTGVKNILLTASATTTGSASELLKQNDYVYLCDPVVK